MATDQKVVHLLGYASSQGGARPGSANGPEVFKYSPYFSELREKGLESQWEAMMSPKQGSTSKLPLIAELCSELANNVNELVRNQHYFTVLGGDHTSAIGTWSGAFTAIQNQGPLGLIWIDAHMDSHTPKTTLTGNFHGMPLACLLGHGESDLIHIGVAAPKIKPEHLCLIGIRSFEPEEAELLERLNVRVFLMSEVKQRGLHAVMQDAIRIVTQGTAGFGVSLDIDSIDPTEAPGTGVPAPDGIHAQELCDVLKLIAGNKHFLGAEIVEFDPQLDIDQKTEKLIPQLLIAMAIGK